jgi:EamA domain-containing membrane protein RarD
MTKFSVNWKTTTLGLLAALGVIVNAWHNGMLDWSTILPAAAVAALGAVAKDNDMTGGTRAQSSEKPE